MPTRRRSDAAASRFSNNEQRGASIMSGYQQVTSDIDAAYLKRNLAAYKKYGLPQDLNKLAKMTDQAREDAAAKAVINKYKAEQGGVKPTKPKPPIGGGGPRPPVGGGAKPQKPSQPQKPKPNKPKPQKPKPDPTKRPPYNPGQNRPDPNKPKGGAGGTKRPKPGPIITRPPVGGGPIKS